MRCAAPDTRHPGNRLASYPGSQRPPAFVTVPDNAFSISGTTAVSEASSAQAILAHAKAAPCRICSGCRPISAQSVSADRIHRVLAGDLPARACWETSRLRREAWAYRGRAKSEAGPRRFSALPALWSCLSVRRRKHRDCARKSPGRPPRFSARRLKTSDYPAARLEEAGRSRGSRTRAATETASPILPRTHTGLHRKERTPTKRKAGACRFNGINGNFVISFLRPTMPGHTASGIPHYRFLTVPRQVHTLFKL